MEMVKQKTSDIEVECGVDVDSGDGDEVQKSDEECYDHDEVGGEQDSSSPEELHSRDQGCKLFQ